MPPRGSTLRFDQRLVLNQYMLGLFGVESFDELAEELKQPEYEEWDENNVSQLHHVLAARFGGRPGLATDDLLRYDQNIVRHTIRISERREGRVRWKYFQYLSLLFAELYLDRYFRNPDGLLAALNEYVRGFNEGKAQADRVPEYARGDLRKLAFWMATGSGKTLVMHVNLLQYLHYLEERDRRDELDKIILLTPNEGLSRQHRGELELSGFDAELFSKSGESLFTGSRIEIIEVTKLAEESSVALVAVDAFEGNNLVLVDEGHRGMSGKEVGRWKSRRDRLCANGFSFEYSATFGQAMKAANDKVQTNEYARCILFNYSYPYFYGDGYGKEYQILNLDNEDAAVRQRYLTAGLLAFYQQQLLFEESGGELRDYGIERPLWMFVGSRVTAGTSQDEKSDVTQILLFLARFVGDRRESIENLELLLSGSTGLIHRGVDLFADKFGYLHKRGLGAEAIFSSILRSFFNAGAAGKLHATVLRAAEGELALSLGDNQPFGVINVGKAPELAKALAEHDEFAVSDDSMSPSLFGELNSRESRVNLLVGARKFAEGWSSWRVSAVGLMKVGKNEGSQIIQLFGRGVRLKGLNFSLKRSSQIPEVRHPEHIEVLETLNVFGVHADYMRQFKEHLEEEGLPSNENPEEIFIPTIAGLNGKKLTNLRLGKGGDFKREGPKPELDLPGELGEATAGKFKVKLDWYPKVEAMESRDGAVTAVRETGKLEAKHLAFMDLDAVYFELVRFKNERGWHNLSLSKEAVVRLLENPNWYELQIPAADLEFGGGRPLERARMWQEIAISLLKAYCKKYYQTRRAEFESRHLEYQALREDDPNFISGYHFQVDASFETAVTKLKELKAEVESGRPGTLDWGALDIFSFDRHLYNPMVHLKNRDISVKPVALNDGEQRFIRDLRAYVEQNPDLLEGRELFVLRNLSRGKGIGFFEAGNFYPDFVLWLLEEERQFVTFVDPKGILRLYGLDDPKIRFYETIKDIQRRLNETHDERVVLNSFIVSNTAYDQLAAWGVTKQQLEDCNVLFQTEDSGTYMTRMFDIILSSEENV